jgi:hypothetical protein
MAIAGNLRTMSPGDLLQWLSLAQKTGTLVVTSPGVEKKIFVEKGRIISSASNDPREYLGQFLMSHGFITEQELKKAMEVQEQSHILLGKILVTIGAISQDDLIRLMRLKAEEEIYDVFLWSEGDFYFIDNELPTMQMVPLQVDATGIIMEGTRRADEWRRIREVISNDTLVPRLQEEVDLTAMSEAERVIVGAVNGQRSIAEIVLESRSSSFVVSRVVFTLARGGQVNLIEPGVIEEIRAEVLAPSDEIAALVEKAQTSLRSGAFENALRQLKAAQTLEPENEQVRAALRGAEAAIAGALRKSGITSAKVPHLRKTLDEITSMNFSPNEGFILSRINGAWDIGSIIKVSPMREADALLIFHRLHKDGVVELIG